MSGAGAASAVTSLAYHIAQKTVSSGLRSVIVHLTNSSSSVLINPQVYTSSGYSYDPPQPTVGKGVTEVCAFGQTKGTARGSVGVLTYDIAKDRKTGAIKRLAIMFSVPFDYNLYENWFALGLFDTSQACNACLYNLMYYRHGQQFIRAKASGSEVSFQGSKYTVRGTMSAVANAEMKLELWDED